MLITRLVFKEIRERGVRSFKSRDLFSFMNSSRSYAIREYIIDFRGLIAQEPEGRLRLVKPGSPIRLVEGQEYCKWHSGPIDKRDNPMERRYCVNLSRSSLGYCLRHLRSDRALYDRCVSGMGNEAFEACKYIDRKYRDLEHVVYLIVLPTGKVKVGVTRRFRIYERIAEQQHLLATELTVTKSILEARRIELKVSSTAKASDKGLRGLVTKTSITVEQAYNLLESMVNIIRRNLRLTPSSIGSSTEFFRITPSRYLAGAQELKALGDNSVFILRDYWGGYIFLEDSNGRIYAVKATRILHKRSLVIL